MSCLIELHSDSAGKMVNTEENADSIHVNTPTSVYLVVGTCQKHWIYIIFSYIHVECGVVSNAMIIRNELLNESSSLDASLLMKVGRQLLNYLCQSISKQNSSPTAFISVHCLIVATTSFFFCVLYSFIVILSSRYNEPDNIVIVTLRAR